MASDGSSNATKNGFPHKLASLSWIFAIPVFFFVTLSAKNIAWIFFVGSLLAILYGNSRRLADARIVVRVALLCLVLTSGVLFSPVDICVRRGDSFVVAIMPVIVQVDTRYLIQDLQQQGKVLDRDFIVYDRRSAFNQVKRALTIVVP